jgi:hypothetical protein
MNLLRLALTLKVVFVRQRLLGMIPAEQRRLFSFHTDRLVLFHPGPDVHATVAGGLHGGNDPHAEKQEGDAEGDERDLVWSKTTELVVKHETVWAGRQLDGWVGRDARRQVPEREWECE